MKGENIMAIEDYYFSRKHVPLTVRSGSPKEAIMNESTRQRVSKSITSSFLLSLVFLVSATAACAAARPVYVIAHRCNDIEDIGKALRKGANSIECDVRIDDPGRQ